jgi:hypothetical protein
MKQFQQTEPTLPVIEPSRAYLHQMGAGALLPLTQTIITAAVFGVVSLVLLWLADVRHPEKYALAIACISLAVSWWKSYRHWFDLTTIEHILNTDLDGDGQIGNAEPEYVHIRLSEVTPDKHYRSNDIDLPISEEKLSTLAAGLLMGRPFSEREWAGTGKPFSSPEFRNLRAEMIKRGLVELANEKDTRQGYVLTHAGKSIMEHYSPYSSPSPTPDVESV